MKKVMENIGTWSNTKTGSILIIGLLGIFFSVGIIGHSLPITFDLMITLTPWVLGVFGFVVLFFALTGHSQVGSIKPQIIWILVSYAITFFLEALGVATGLVFGQYSYGNTLGFQLFQTPVIIGLNWVIVVLGITVVTLKFTQKPWLVATIVGLLCVVFDVILEPLAIHPDMDYWSWAGGPVPVHNYIAWFIISFGMAFVYALKIKHPIRSWILPGYWIIQMIFFVSIRLFVLGV